MIIIFVLNIVAKLSSNATLTIKGHNNLGSTTMFSQTKSCYAL